MHIGVKIKIARITKNLTQEELAYKINKTRPLVSHIEQTGKANIYTLKKICSVLGLDIDELQNEVNEPKAAYSKDEIKRLKEEISLLKELVSSQKEVIAELKQKLQRKKK
jgi:transcriptional regulator with XRE-family HTH domain